MLKALIKKRYEILYLIATVFMVVMMILATLRPFKSVNLSNDLLDILRYDLKNNGKFNNTHESLADSQK